MAAPDDQEASGAIICVMVSDLSGVLGQLVTRLVEQQADMSLARQTHGPLKLLQAMGPEVDVLILGAAQVRPAPGICSHLLQEFPHLRILVLAHNGGDAALYWLGLRRERVRDVSLSHLARTIRTAYALNATV